MTWPTVFNHLVDDIFSLPVFLLVVAWMLGKGIAFTVKNQAPKNVNVNNAATLIDNLLKRSGSANE